MNTIGNTRIEILKRYLLEDPLDSFLSYALALELIKINELADAEKLFKELLIQDPEYLATYYHYGNLLEILQQPELAADIYKTGIRIAINQNNPQTLKELEAALDSLTGENDETE